MKGCGLALQKQRLNIQLLQRQVLISKLLVNYSVVYFWLLELHSLPGTCDIPYLPTLPVFPGVSKFFIKSPGLLVRAPDLPGNTYHAFFQFFFINLVIFEMSERKIKQEVKLVLLFELFSIGKHKTEQSY